MYSKRVLIQRIKVFGWCEQHEVVQFCKLTDVDRYGGTAMLKSVWEETVCDCPNTSEWGSVSYSISFFWM